MGIFKRTDKSSSSQHLDGAQFTFIRSDTLTNEVIHPPNLGSESNPGKSDARRSDSSQPSQLSQSRKSSKSSKSSNRLSLDLFRPGGGKEGGGSSDDGRDRSASVSSRLSRRFRLSRTSSKAGPQDLPETIARPSDDGEDRGDQWEELATVLARENERHRNRPGSSSGDRGEVMTGAGAVTGAVTGAVSSQAIDADIRTAIRLHEEGKLPQSTAMFARLANPNGPNNPLSQVLYGLALRHGWGCAPDPASAMTYLSAAASNAAEIEKLALQAGLKKGGAAKGELVLAIFELGNCFRHGWGVRANPEAAKLYYETAAHLGDTDAMNELADCYLRGFGTKRDKFAAARYYRLAETNGNKTLGNSWIWKEKYDAPK